MADMRPPGVPDADVMLLGRYAVRKELGRGGFGVVVRAFDIKVKREVAIKTLNHSAETTDPTLFELLKDRFESEAEATARMGVHPNVVTFYHLDSDHEGTLYLILEYVAGGTLAERLTRGPLPLADALRLTVDVAQGLQAAHEHGIVHRDIKPANIFLTADGRAKVGDFGVAQIEQRSVRTRATHGHPGTLAYMSPEQQLHPYLRPASDQYSLGLVLFEMVTGKRYRDVGDRQAARLLEEQHPAVAAVIARMIENHPDDRYPSMVDVIVALRAIDPAAQPERAPGMGHQDPSMAGEATTRPAPPPPWQGGPYEHVPPASAGKRGQLEWHQQATLPPVAPQVGRAAKATELAGNRTRGAGDVWGLVGAGAFLLSTFLPFLSYRDGQHSHQSKPFLFVADPLGQVAIVAALVVIALYALKRPRSLVKRASIYCMVAAIFAIGVMSTVATSSTNPKYDLPVVEIFGGFFIMLGAVIITFISGIMVWRRSRRSMPRMEIKPS